MAFGGVVPAQTPAGDSRSSTSRNTRCPKGSKYPLGGSSRDARGVDSVPRGTANEAGRTGFEHLFENDVQGSKHIETTRNQAAGRRRGRDQRHHRVRSQNYSRRAVNRSSSHVAESDRGVYARGPSTREKREKQDVSDERRQRYENRPYASPRGAVSVVPKGPLPRRIIGSHADIRRRSSRCEGLLSSYYAPNTHSAIAGISTGGRRKNSSRSTSHAEARTSRPPVKCDPSSRRETVVVEDLRRAPRL